jgi:hypothetical protein
MAKKCTHFYTAVWDRGIHWAQGQEGSGAPTGHQVRRGHGHPHGHHVRRGQRHPLVTRSGGVQWFPLVTKSGVIRGTHWSGIRGTHWSPGQEGLGVPTGHQVRRGQGHPTRKYCRFFTELQ